MQMLRAHVLIQRGHHSGDPILALAVALAPGRGEAQGAGAPHADDLACLQASCFDPLPSSPHVPPDLTPCPTAIGVGA